MNDIEFRALGKDGIWRYGKYPWHGADMSNTVIGLQAFWTILPVLRRETLGQWTGLKDTQGKKIYEGDILKVTNPNGELDRQCTVEWDEHGCYPYEPHEGYGEFDITAIGWAMDMEYAFEVIGNIYENPELIKQES